MNDQQRAAIQHYEAALKAAFPEGATGEVFNHWNEARKALAQTQDKGENNDVSAMAGVEQNRLGSGAKDGEVAQPQDNTARCGGCDKTAKDGWALYCVECWEKAQPQDTECPCGSECEKCSARCLPQESFSDCIWYTYIDFNEKPPYFRYDTGDNTAKENESTYYEIQEELKQFGYTIEDVYIDHDTICGDIVSINKELAQPQGEWVDLTDDEMWDVFISKDWTGEPLNLMSAVIASFKEKNK